MAGNIWGPTGNIEYPDNPNNHRPFDFSEILYTLLKYSLKNNEKVLRRYKNRGYLIDNLSILLLI